MEISKQFPISKDQCIVQGLFEQYVEYAAMTLIPQL